MIAAAVHQTRQQMPAGFSLEMEPGHEEIWLTIRDMPKNFTAGQLAAAAGAPLGKVQFYLAQLTSHGRAQSVGVTTDKQPLYAAQQLAQRPVVLNEHGRPSSDFEKRAAIWTAIRMNRNGFSIASIFDIVTEHTVLTRKTVAAYISRLEEAGYVIEMEGENKRGQSEFQLRPAMNSGPLPPRLCEAALVYDVNRRAFYGHGIAHEVQL